MGAGTRIICSRAALLGARAPAQGRAARSPRLASGCAAHGAAAVRLGSRDRAHAPCLRRETASDGARRPGALPWVRQGLVPRLLPRGLPALRTADRAADVRWRAGLIFNA